VRGRQLRNWIAQSASEYINSGSDFEDALWD